MDCDGVVEDVGPRSRMEFESVFMDHVLERWSIIFAIGLLAVEFEVHPASDMVGCTEGACSDGIARVRYLSGDDCFEELDVSRVS